MKAKNDLLKSTGRCSSSDGTSIFYQVWGAGAPTLICCNGIVCTTVYWHYIVNYFAPNCTVITWDYRGHGGSQDPEDLNRLRIEDFANDLESVYEHLNIEKAVLIGHSMGVQVIFEYYRKSPEKVEALVPICGSVGKPLNVYGEGSAYDSLWHILFDILEVSTPLISPVVKPLLRTDFAMFMAEKIGINKIFCPKEEMKLYFDHISKMDLRVIFKAFKFMGEHSAEDVLPDVKVPVIIFAGEEDKMTPLKFMERLSDMLPEAHYYLIPKGQHTALIERPELINIRLRDFLKEDLGYFQKTDESSFFEELPRRFR